MTLYEISHEVHTIKIRSHCFDARNNLCQWLNMCRNVPETVLRIRKIQVLSKTWAKSQTKAQKSSKDEFIREIWLPVQESRRSVLYPGELPCMVLVPKLSNYYKLTINIWPLRPPSSWNFHFRNHTCTKTLVSLFLPNIQIYGQETYQTFSRKDF